MTFKLEQAQRLIDSALTDLKENPEIDAVDTLLDACESIDLYYKNRFCKEMDSEYNDPEGTTYEHGISLEFYIEADWWHDVSKALRILRPEKDV